MKVTQAYELVNNSTKQFLGEDVILNNDLSNIVDIGKELFTATSVENYTKALVDQIGKMVFVNRPYMGNVPSVLMDTWEFGSVLEKVSIEMPEATENESWELVDKAVYEQDIFYKPSVSVKFFNSKVTFEIPFSICEEQVKSAFTSPTQMNSFLSAIMTAVENSMQVKLDSLIMDTIDNMIAHTIKAEYGAEALGSKSTVKAVNLLHEYNATVTTPIKAADALTNPDFIRFASYRMGLYEKRLQTMSKLFNIGGKARHTTPDRLHVALLNDFAAAANVYLQSDTFHNEFTKLPNAEIVTYWQGSGTDFGFGNTSAIDVKIDVDGTPTEVKASGILGCMWDRYALGVNYFNRRTRSHVNNKAEFINNWAKMDASYFNDLNENFVVFFIADNA